MQVNKIGMNNFYFGSFGAKKPDDKKSEQEEKNSNYGIANVALENQGRVLVDNKIPAKSVFLISPDFYVAEFEDGMKRKYTWEGECLQAEKPNGTRYNVDKNNTLHQEENERYEKLTPDRIAEVYDHGEYARKLNERLNLLFSMVSAKRDGDTSKFNELCDSLKDKRTGRYNLSID